MKRGVRIVNCARGGIVDEAALADAIRDGQVAAPRSTSSSRSRRRPIIRCVQLDQVIATPHLGASTGEAQVNVAVAIAQQVADFLTTRHDPQRGERAVAVAGGARRSCGPYLTLAEKLGSLAAQLARERRSEVIGRGYAARWRSAS